MPIDLDALKGQASDFLQSDQMKDLTPYLLSGGGGALLGALMSGGRRESAGEGRLGHLGRVLRNALLTGGLAGGSHALLNKGWNKTFGAMNRDQMITGGAEDQGPVGSTARNVAFSPLTAAASGLAALGLTRDNALLGVGDRDYAMQGALDKINENRGGKGQPKAHTAAKLDRMTPAEVDRLGIGAADRRAAGLPSERVQNGLLQKLFGGSTSATKGRLSSGYRRGVGRLMGQTPGRMATRGAVGLAAAGIPALLGAYLTNRAD